VSFSISKFFTCLFFLLISKLSLGQNLSQKEKDELYLNHSGIRIQKLKKNFINSWNKVFINFTENETYLLAGVNYAKQEIKSTDYNSSFYYNLNNYSENVYKKGYYAGLRLDGLYKETHSYSLAFMLSKLYTGTYYKDAKIMNPISESFSNFKADNQFLNLGITLHYKKLFAISDTSKYKFYVVGGPCIDARLSKQSIDNEVNKSYNRFLLSGEIGTEFNNNNLYTLFLHYKKNLVSFTKAPIKTNLSTVEIGVMIKTDNLF
jgi:hypothetical protein